MLSEVRNMAERIWTGDVRQQYPLKWVVMVNLDWHPTIMNMKMGEVYAVKDTFCEALELKESLGDSMGKTTVVEGHDPYTLYVGGLTICKQS
jgi:hypothetical protein